MGNTVIILLVGSERGLRYEHTHIPSVSKEDDYKTGRRDEEMCWRGQDPPPTLTRIPAKKEKKKKNWNGTSNKSASQSQQRNLCQNSPQAYKAQIYLSRQTQQHLVTAQLVNM